MTKGKLISHAAFVLALAAVGGPSARADEVPELNIDPVCRGIAAHASGPSECGGPDLSFSQ